MLWEELRKGKTVIGRWGNRREEMFKPVSSGSYYIPAASRSGELSVSVHKWKGSCVMHCCHFWLGGLIPDTFQKQLDLLESIEKFFYKYAKADFHVSTFCSKTCVLSNGPEKSIYNVYFMILMLNRRSSVCAVLQTCHIANAGMHHLGALVIQTRQVQVQTLEVRPGSSTSAAQQTCSLLPLCCLLSHSQSEQVSLENLVKGCLTASLSKMHPVQYYPVCMECK